MAEQRSRQTRVARPEPKMLLAIVCFVQQTPGNRGLGAALVLEDDLPSQQHAVEPSHENLQRHDWRSLSRLKHEVLQVSKLAHELLQKLGLHKPPCLCPKANIFGSRLLRMVCKWKRQDFEFRKGLNSNLFPSRAGRRHRTQMNLNL